MLTRSNERQRETETREGMRALVPWRQGDPSNYATNLKALAHAALRHHYAFDKLWHAHIRNIIYTGLKGMPEYSRILALKPFYIVRREYYWHLRRGAIGA